MKTNLLIGAVFFSTLVACDKGGTGSDDSGGSLTWDDKDGDSILDIHEGTDDFDGDGIANEEDLDSDGDSIEDMIESGDTDPLTLPIDSEDDGNPDYLDLDSDNNCIPDQVERGNTTGLPIDFDRDNSPDFRDLDNDGDGIKDYIEIGSNCATPDSDGDTIPDYMDIDSDGDGVGDLYEGGTTDWNDEPRDTDGDGIPDYLDQDSDDDGFLDADEGGTGGDPTVPPLDTDGDGIYNFADTDSDGDGLSEQDERDVYGTDPYNADTDGDGYSDGAEITADTDPLDSGSIIEGLYVTVPERSSVEQLFEFELRIEKADVGWICDTTCSMSSVYNAMTAEFSTMVTELEVGIPDLATGAAYHDDFNYSVGSDDFGSGPDKPFGLYAQMSEDHDAVQEALSHYTNGYGDDGPESSMEAVYQAAKGAGFDQDSDGLYDTVPDVVPFISGSDADVFDGASPQAYNPADDTTGTLGGFGFRDFALPVIVLATDNYMRDWEIGYHIPAGSAAAGHTATDDAINALNAYFIGISVGSTMPKPQMLDIADATGSYGDIDGDGISEPLVLDYTSGSGDDLRAGIVNAIFGLVDAVTFSEVSLNIEGDDWGFVTSITPDKYTDVQELDGEVVEFVLTFLGTVPALEEDQLFKLTLQVLGDNSVLLSELDIIVLVPGQES